MGSKRIRDMAQPQNLKDAVNKEYLENNYIATWGGIMTGNLLMNNAKLRKVGNPADTKDAVNLGYADARYVKQIDANSVVTNAGDTRYVRKGQITLGEWTWGYKNVGSTWKYPYFASAWPASVRSDPTDTLSNIIIKNVTFDNEVSKATLWGATLHFQLMTVGFNNSGVWTTSIIDLGLMDLSDAAYSDIGELYTDNSTVTYSIYINKKCFLGLEDAFVRSHFYNIGLKVTGITQKPEVIVTYQFNNDGQ